MYSYTKSHSNDKNKKVHLEQKIKDFRMNQTNNDNNQQWPSLWYYKLYSDGTVYM